LTGYCYKWFCGHRHFKHLFSKFSILGLVTVS